MTGKNKKFTIYCIAKIFYSSITNLFKKQPDIFTNTSQAHMTERNLVHHLANAIAKYIFWLNQPAPRYQKLVSLVDKILENTKVADSYLSSPQKQAKVKELEKQIDLMVHK